MSDTLEQLDIYSACVDTYLNLLLEAGAGCGKTYVIRNAIRRMLEANDRLKILYLVFNKKNETEFQNYPEAKLLGVTAKTINAMGYAVSREYVKYVNTKSGYKTADVLERHFERFLLKLGENSAPDCKEIAKRLSMKWMNPYESAFSLLKNNLIHDRIDEAGLAEVYANFDFDIPSPEDFEDWEVNSDDFFWQVYSETHLEKTFDFTDQFYRPIKFHWEISRKYDVVFVDERQDLSLAKIEFIRSLGKRFVFVGDTAQTIYGFTGAYPKCLSHIQETFGTKSLPLTTNWRCSTSVLDFAAAYAPRLTPRDSAPLGEVKAEMTVDDLMSVVKPQDAILSRVNAPLVKMAYLLLSEGLPCFMYGQTILKDLQVALKGGKKGEARQVYRSKDELLTQVKSFYDKKIAKAKSAPKQLYWKDQQSVADLIFAHIRLDQLSDLDSYIHKIFENDPYKSVHLLSIHKSKGLEWDNVYLICPELIPHPMVKTEFDLQQETNLKYVAATRAKLTYGLVWGFNDEADDDIDDGSLKKTKSQDTLATIKGTIQDEHDLYDAERDITELEFN